jgi:hypothetical protein
MSKEGLGDLSRRIDEAPSTTREDLVERVFGPDSPRAMEWVDLQDAGTYVDEMSVPIYQDGDCVIQGEQIPITDAEL